MSDENHKELQLLPSPPSDELINQITIKPPPPPSPSSDLDLKLSIGCIPRSRAETMRREAAEQIRITAMEKAYAERVRELTRREMELARSDFARARHVWQRAREEVDRAQRLQDMAIRRLDAAAGCLEITCHSCRQRFWP